MAAAVLLRLPALAASENDPSRVCVGLLGEGNQRVVVVAGDLTEGRFRSVRRGIVALDEHMVFAVRHHGIKTKYGSNMGVFCLLNVDGGLMA